MCVYIAIRYFKGYIIMSINMLVKDDELLESDTEFGFIKMLRAIKQALVRNTLFFFISIRKQFFFSLFKKDFTYLRVCVLTSMGGCGGQGEGEAESLLNREPNGPVVGVGA